MLTNRIIWKEQPIEYSISVCKVVDYQNFPHKYKENVSFCVSLYLNVLKQAIKRCYFSDKSNIKSKWIDLTV